MSNKTKILSDLAVDDALVQDANYRFDSNDRQYIDEQIRGTQQLVVEGLADGVLGTYFDLSGSSAGVIEGDTVCPAGIGEEVTKSTLAALTAAGTVTGVVLRAAPAGSKVLVAIGGQVPASITQLEPAAGFGRVNTSTSRVEMVASISGSDFGIGRVTQTGALIVVPGIGVSAGGGGSSDAVSFRGTPLNSTVPTDDEVWVRRGSEYVAANAMPKRWYDPRRYGAKLDGVTDDIAAFEAMHAAMPNKGAVVYMPGIAWLSRTWRINKRVKLIGYGGDLSSAFESGFFVAPGFTALQYDGTGNGLDPTNDSAKSTIEAVDFRSRILVHESATGSAGGLGIPAWQANQPVSVGDCRTKAGGVSPGYFFRATAITANGGKGPGTTTAAQPGWSLTVGSTLTDTNGITWTTEKFPTVHATSTAYAVGDRVYAPSDNRYYFECEVAGTSAGSRPSQLVGGDGASGVSHDSSFTDGTVTWRIKCAAGIRLHSNLCKFNDMVFTAFTGYAIVVAGGVGIVDAGYTNANVNNLSNVYAQYTGGGIHFSGSDCNGWRLSHYVGFDVGVYVPTPNTVTAAGYSGLGGHHIHDHSLAGGLIEQSYGELNTGRPILKNGLGLLTVVSMFAETVDKALCSSGRMSLIGGSVHVEPSSILTMKLDPEAEGRGIREEDTTTATQFYCKLTAQDGYSIFPFGLLTGSDVVNNFSLRYGFGGIPSGCWGMQFGNQSLNTSYLLYSSGAGIGYGAGFFGLPLGQFVGLPGSDTPIFDGRYSALTDRRVRGGARKTGDTYRSQTDSQTILEDGYRARTWTANTQVSADVTAWAIPATNVEPTSNTGKPGEQIWKCTTGGTTHATTEPTWPASPTPGVTTQTDGTATWTFLGYRPARVLEQRTSKCRGPHYRALEVQTTTATASQVLDSGGAVSGEDLALPASAVCRVTHLLTVHKTSTANGGTIEIKSDWVRNGTAAPTQIGSTVVVYNLSGTTLDGTTVAHVANGNRIELQCSPESADTLNWRVIRTQVEGVD